MLRILSPCASTGSGVDTAYVLVFCPAGEGCVALRAAESAYTEFHVTLTHHGERTGDLSGGIQVHTSEGKQTEKLYGGCTHKRIHIHRPTSHMPTPHSTRTSYYALRESHMNFENPKCSWMSNVSSIDPFQNQVTKRMNVKQLPFRHLV